MRYEHKKKNKNSDFTKKEITTDFQYTSLIWWNHRNRVLPRKETKKKKNIVWTSFCAVIFERTVLLSVCVYERKKKYNIQFRNSLTKLAWSRFLYLCFAYIVLWSIKFFSSVCGHKTSLYLVLFFFLLKHLISLLAS